MGKYIDTYDMENIMEFSQKTEARTTMWGFSGDSVVKNLLRNAGDMGSNPDPRFHMPWTN